LLRLPGKRSIVHVDGHDDAHYPEHSWMRRKFEPMKLVNAVSFASKLRQVAEFTDALEDVDWYNCPDGNPPPKRDRKIDPSRSTIDRAAAVVDIVGMLMHRRVFEDVCANDATQSIRCYSDSSPVVGNEMQGMLCDFIHFDGSMRRTTLPGMTLHYGHYDAVNKVIAFVWAVWLMCGPTLTTMTYFFKGVFVYHIFRN